MKEIFTTPDISKAAAEKFVEIAREAIEERGLFTVALSGGSTPKKLYSMLAEEPYRSLIEWKKVFFFFGDERHVPPDDLQSNFRMANENLFQPLKISKENIFRWITEEKSPEVVADDYESWLWSFFTEKGLHTEKDGDDEPTFDLILLGMGADGHTASLFPFTEALHETDKIAVENWVEKLNAWRFTLTIPTINRARNVIFLVSGEDKADTLHEVLHGDFQPDKLPSQAVKPTDGNLLFITDIELADSYQPSVDS